MAVSRYLDQSVQPPRRQEKITCSMSAKGCCWDNAVVESFFSTLKLELNLDDDRDVLISPQQLQRDLAFWIEGYYNRERQHSTMLPHPHQQGLAQLSQGPLQLSQ